MLKGSRWWMSTVISGLLGSDLGRSMVDLWWISSPDLSLKETALARQFFLMPNVYKTYY